MIAPVRKLKKEKLFSFPFQILGVETEIGQIPKCSRHSHQVMDGIQKRSDRSR